MTRQDRLELIVEALSVSNPKEPFVFLCGRASVLLYNLDFPTGDDGTDAQTEQDDAA